MYKTVRHGENSLQYTILPQTEEVLNNSGLKGKGRDYSPSIHIRRSRRRSTVKYVLLIMFGIIIALALAAVPLYVMNGTLFSRKILTDHNEMDTSAPIISTTRETASSQKKELMVLPEIISTAEIKPDISTSTVVLSTASTISSAVTREQATTPPWTMPALRSWKSSTIFTTVKATTSEGNEVLPLISTLPSSNHMTMEVISVKPWDKDIIIRPTATPEPITLRTDTKQFTETQTLTERPTTTGSKIFDDRLITSKATRTPTKEFATGSDSSKFRDLKDTLLEIDDDKDIKESLEVDEVFFSKDGPFKTDSASVATENDEVTVSKAGDGGWYGARWPFVDTLSHFQWTDYSPGDNLLLPLLIAALSSVALVLLLALAVRRRKRAHTAAAKIGKVTADVNTKLLTAENPEEGEE